MTRFALLAAALVSTAFACTEGAPEQLELELADDALPRELALPDYEVVPELEQAAADVVPRLELTSPDKGGYCPIDLVANGFPAISVDGHTLVMQRSGMPGNSDIEVHSVVFFDVEGDEQAELVFENDYADQNDCEAIRRAAQAKVDELNAELADQQWRALEQLPAPLAPRWHAGWFSIRIPGERVIERQARPELRNPIDEGLCDVAPTFDELWFDRATRRAIVTFDYEGASCMCGNDQSQAALVLGQATIDAVAVIEESEWGC
jgi:hypothetical protein